MAPSSKATSPSALSSLALALAFLLPLALTAIVGLVPFKSLPPLDNPSFTSSPSFTPLPANATEYALRSAAFPSLFHLFLSLPPPSPPLHGEYLADMLEAGSFAGNVIGWTGFTPFFPGAWVGKSFVQAKEGKEGDEGKEEGGWGYNVFRWCSARVYRRFRMQTSVVTSVWDGKPSFELQYGGEKHLLGQMKMRDEVREVRPGLYLGMGTFGYSHAKRHEDPLPFLLRGPFQPPRPEEVRE